MWKTPRGGGTRRKREQQVVLLLLLLLLCAGGRAGGSKKASGAARRFTSEDSRREEATRLFDVAQTYRERGDAAQAAEVFDEVAEIAFDNPDAQYHAGMAHLQMGALDRAQQRWELAVQLDPEHTTASFNLATLLAERGDLAGSTRLMEKVIDMQPDDADNHKTLAILHFKQNLNEKAIAGYMRCIRAAPLHADCFCGMGNSFIKIGRHEEALDAYTAAVNINPQEPGYLNNVGNLLVRHQRFNTTAQAIAVQHLQSAIDLDGGYADGYFNLGEAYSAMHQHAEATRAIRMAMKLDPARTDYKCTLHLDMRKLCDWSDFGDYTRDLEHLWKHGTPKGMAERSSAVPTRKPGEPKSRRREKEVTLCPSPLDALSYDLSLEVYRNVAQGHGEEARYFALKHVPLATAAWPLSGGRRLRVGYLSIELRDRPVGKDMVHAFNAHHEYDVEVECFSLNPSPRQGVQGEETLWWHGQMLRACDAGFHDMSGVAFTDIARRINEARPHVLVNLDGWTSAPLINEIVILTPAPVQLSFKGFPGTTGVAEHHGLVADRVVTPPEMVSGYVERLVLLPHSYHYNGHEHLYAHMYRRTSDASGEYVRAAGWPSRSDLVQGKFMMPSNAGQRPVEALAAAAADRVLLCNFNQFYKIVPEVWQVWMGLLGALPHASLWLLAWNEAGKASLQRHAGARAHQLTFTTFFAEKWHTAAKGACDLFIDTFPYSSHGTAADALYAGVPVVTLPGESMASRVGTSLSLAAGAGPTLIARNLADYRAVAHAAAARGRAQLERLRGSESVLASPAFDSRRWAASYVQSLKMLWDSFAHAEQQPGALAHPHVVAAEAGARRQHLAAGVRTRAGAGGGASTAGGVGQGGDGGGAANAGARGAARGAASHPAPRFGRGEGGAAAAGGAGFAIKSSKYQAPPAFGNPSTPPRRTPPSWNAGGTEGGGGAAGTGGKISGTGPAAAGAPSSGGWSVPSKRTGVAPSASSQDPSGVNGGRVGSAAGNRGTGGKPTVKIPSW